MEPIPVSAAAARRFLVQRHLLAPARALPAGLDGVRAAFERLGSIQFDPLAVAGRNHDLVLHARVSEYDPAWTSELLYGSRELFETYNKGLSLLPTSELPWHRLSWDRFLAAHADDAFVRHSETMEHVLERIREDGPLSSLDFEKRATVDWYWGPTSEVRAVLEALSEAGIISLSRRDGNRRYFDLTERLYPAELLEIRPDERDQRRHKLLSRYRAHGLLGEGGQTELWYGIAPARRRATDPADLITRTDLRAELVAAGDLVPVMVEGVRGVRYVLGECSETSCPCYTKLQLRPPAENHYLGPASSSWRHSTPSSGIATCCGACSDSTTSGRSTCPSANAAGATTCCRYCGAIGWSAASSRASIDRRGRCASWACGGRTVSVQAAVTGSSRPYGALSEPSHVSVACGASTGATTAPPDASSGCAPRGLDA